MLQFFKKKKRIYSKTEDHICGIVLELLKLSGTDINYDELGEKYYVNNDEHHLSITIFSNEYVIRLTNTKDSIAEKYNKDFVEEILKLIKNEKHRRMEMVMDAIASSIEGMAERLHNSLIESNCRQVFKTEKKDPNLIRIRKSI